MEVYNFYEAYNVLGFKIGTFDVRSIGVDIDSQESLLEYANSIFDEYVDKVIYIGCEPRNPMPLYLVF